MLTSFRQRMACSTSLSGFPAATWTSRSPASARLSRSSSASSGVNPGSRSGSTTPSTTAYTQGFEKWAVRSLKTVLPGFMLTVSSLRNQLNLTCWRALATSMPCISFKRQPSFRTEDCANLGKGRVPGPGRRTTRTSLATTRATLRTARATRTRTTAFPRRWPKHT